MKTLYFILLLLSAGPGLADGRNKQLSFTMSDNAPAKPFGKLSGFFTQNFNPGFKDGYGIIWKVSEKHEQFGDISAGHFYHHFLQHGLSLYTNIGYRYKFNKYISADASPGIGTMPYIRDTSNEVLNQKNECEKNCNAAHMQTIALLSVSISYTIDSAVNKPVKISTRYQRKIQFTFIREYVPMLPYNSLSFGIIISL